MPLARCPRCSKLFDKKHVSVCTTCETAEEEDYETVRSYLEKNPNRTTAQVAKNTGVSKECVLRLVEEGRIKNVAAGEGIWCGRCGAPAISTSKRLCEACLKKLNAELVAQQSRVSLPEKDEVRLNERAHSSYAPPAGAQDAVTGEESSRRVREVIDDKRRWR